MFYEDCDSQTNVKAEQLEGEAAVHLCSCRGNATPGFINFSYWGYDPFHEKSSIFIQRITSQGCTKTLSGTSSPWLAASNFR
jgi:hypothetical protein